MKMMGGCNNAKGRGRAAMPASADGVEAGTGRAVLDGLDFDAAPFLNRYAWIQREHFRLVHKHAQALASQRGPSPLLPSQEQQ